MIQTLSQTGVGKIVHLKACSDPRMELKLLSMGIRPGTKLLIRRKTILGNTLYISVEGKNYALRKQEAKTIEVE